MPHPLLRAVVPAPLRVRGRHLLNRLSIAWGRATGSKVVRTPPAEFVQGIGGSWEIGEQYLRHFRELAGLQPGETVLEAGCGVGRMATPLIPYLGPTGRYEGFDIVKKYVDWCRRAITPIHPNFRFQHADVFNREYNPAGPVQAGEYRFPYADGTFDFAFLTSVFTHLMPADAVHYLAEVGRVLKPGGRAVATFFLLNGESSRLTDAGRGRFGLLPAEGVYRVHRADVPEACIALDEAFVEGAVKAAGLTLDPVRYGFWCGRDPGYDFQDILILRKPG